MHEIWTDADQGLRTVYIWCRKCGLTCCWYPKDPVLSTIDVADTFREHSCTEIFKAMNSHKFDLSEFVENASGIPARLLNGTTIATKYVRKRKICSRCGAASYHNSFGDLHGTIVEYDEVEVDEDCKVRLMRRALR